MKALSAQLTAAIPGPLARLVDELSVGVAHLSGEGAILATNAAAAALLEGSSGASMAAALERLVVRAAVVAPPVTEASVPGPLGDVRVLLTAADGEGWLALLHRDATKRLRDQAIALRGMLGAAVECENPEAALQRSLDAMASVCRGSRLEIWAPDASGQLEPALRSRTSVASPLQAGLGAEDDGAALVQRALQSGLPVHAPRVARAADPGLRAHGDGGAALAVPACDGDDVVGVLLAVGPRLGEGELRLLTGLADAAGALLGRVRERTAREEAEARAERARAVAVEREGLATLGHLAACVTHEIAGPLGCLGTNLHAAQESLEALGEAKAAGSGAALAEVASELGQVLRDASGDIERVLALIQSLRGLYRRPGDERLRFDPVAPVRDAVRIFRGGRRAAGEIRLQAPSRLPDVEGSPGMLCQVVLNLLDNAFDASGGQGLLEVRLGEGPGRQVTLEVADEGPGIPAEVAGKVFDAYFTTKPAGQGTGLGLYISRDVVERMGGTISFTTGPAGTTFRVALPAA